MSDETANAKLVSTTAPVEPDAHGQAAMLLVESLLHTLIATGALTPAQALETVDIAGEVKEEVAIKDGESSKRMNESLALLSAIGLSLKSSFADRANG